MKKLKPQVPSKEQHSKPQPIKGKNDVAENPDQHIDQDFPGFPHNPAKPETINSTKNSDQEATGPKKKAPGEIIMDLPEVKDIPGQEFIHPPRIGEMADTTISSADEEGEGLLDDLNEDGDLTDADQQSNVSRSESRLLSSTDRPLTEERLDLEKLKLDSSDGGESLNEKGNPLDLGEDLDLGGNETDDLDEEPVDEDEENKPFSVPD